MEDKIVVFVHYGYEKAEMNTERAKEKAEHLLAELQSDCHHMTSTHENDLIVCFDCGIILGKVYDQVVAYVDDDPDGENRSQYLYTIFDDRFYGVKAHG